MVEGLVEKVAKEKSSERLKTLGSAHLRYVNDEKDHTAVMEDYLEIIYELMQEKGYARTVDISYHLHVKSPSVTRMIQKLHAENFLVYEKYRGITLTPKGQELALSVRRRHEMLSRLLIMLGVNDRIAHEDTEGIEHHLHPETLQRITKFVRFLQNNPSCLEQFVKFSYGPRISD